MDNIGSFTATIGGGFIGGVLLGYALKKVVRIAAIIVGLFFAGLVFLQYQQIASINWDNFEVSIAALASDDDVELWYSSNWLNGIRFYSWIHEG